MTAESSPAWAVTSKRTLRDLLLEALVCRMVGHAPVLAEVSTTYFEEDDPRLRGGPCADQPERSDDEGRLVICRRCLARVGD